MNKADIVFELRRSACEDVDPWMGVHPSAFFVCSNHWLNLAYPAETMGRLGFNDLRTFLLLVACALEDGE